MKVLIYGKPGCRFCEESKILCFENYIEFKYEQLGSDYKREKLEEMVPGFETFPQIFIMEDGFAEHVGGFEELKKRLS